VFKGASQKGSVFKTCALTTALSMLVIISKSAKPDMTVKKCNAFTIVKIFLNNELIISQNLKLSK
jgi:hypothetical protein